MLEQIAMPYLKFNEWLKLNNGKIEIQNIIPACGIAGIMVQVIYEEKQTNLKYESIHYNSYKMLPKEIKNRVLNIYCFYNYKSCEPYCLYLLKKLENKEEIKIQENKVQEVKTQEIKEKEEVTNKLMKNFIDNKIMDSFKNTKSTVEEVREEAKKEDKPEIKEETKSEIKEEIREDTLKVNENIPEYIDRRKKKQNISN